MNIFYYVLLSVVIVGVVLRAVKDKRKRTAPSKVKTLNISNYKKHTNKFSGGMEKIKCKEIIKK